MNMTARYPNHQGDAACSDPADQPKDPGTSCQRPPVRTPPEVTDPTVCEPDCECPHDCLRDHENE